MQHIARRRRRGALRPAGAQAESIVPKRTVALSSDGPLCMRIFAGSRDSHPDVTSRRRRGCVLSAGPTQPESVRIRPMAASSVVERLLLRISCVQRGSATGCALHAAVYAPTTRCTLHAAVDAPTAASVVDAMRGGGAYWGSLCACDCFTEVIVVVLYLCSSCLLVFVPAMPPSCLKVHAHALSVGKRMCGSNKYKCLRLHGRGRGAPLALPTPDDWESAYEDAGSRRERPPSLDECAVNGTQLPFADRLQVPRKTPSLLPQTRSTGGAYDVLASVGLRPAAAPSVGRLKGNEQHASCRTRVDHDLRRELRRAYKAAGVSQDEVEELAVYISVSAGSVQAVRPAAGRGVASFGYRPVADQVACDRYRPVAVRAATESDESELTRAACCRSHGCGETKRQNKERAPPFQIFYRDLGGKHGALDDVCSDDTVSTVLHRIAAKLGVSEVATSKLRLLKAGKQLQVSGAACGLVKGDTVHVLGTLRGGVNVDAWQSPIYHKRQRAGAVPYASRKQTREALKPRNANECTPSLATAKKFTVRLKACRHDYRRPL